MSLTTSSIRTLQRKLYLKAKVEQLAQGEGPRQLTFPAPLGVRGTRRLGHPERAPMAAAVGLEVKPVGEPDAGNPHVRFDERGEETGRWSIDPKLPRLSSTLREKCDVSSDGPQPCNIED
jgi:hypothetical protein